MKKLRKQARPQVLTNPDSGLKSHLAHCTQTNQSRHSRSWAKGSWNVLEALSDSTLLAEPLTQHHVSDPLLVNCPHHYVSRTESRQMRRHRKLSLSHQYVSVTRSTSAVSKASHRPCRLDRTIPVKTYCSRIISSNTVSFSECLDSKSHDRLNNNQEPEPSTSAPEPDSSTCHLPNTQQHVAF